MDFRKITRNMEIRKQAEEAAQLLKEEYLEDLTEEEQDRFWSNLFDKASGLLNSIPEPDHPLTYEQAMEWAGRAKIPFGKHQGKRVIDVPASYLDWLEGQPDFRRELRAYTGSRYYQQQHSKGLVEE